MTDLFCPTALLPQGWADNVLLRIGADGALDEVLPGAACPIDARVLGGPVIPGMANLHSHAFQRAMAGLAERAGAVGGMDSFWNWRETMYGFLRRLSPDTVEAVATLLFMEMLSEGYTAVAEFHYLHLDPEGRPYPERAEIAHRIQTAAANAGIGLILLPALYAHGGFGGAPPTAGQTRFLNSVDHLFAIFETTRATARALPGQRVGLALHSLRAVTEGEMNAALAALDAVDDAAPIHIHVAEQTAEIEASLAWSGQRPVAWLLDHAPVDARWCLIHATHIDAGEIAGIARSGAVAGLCPSTEANLGDGIFPAEAFLSAGGRFGIGTDSHVTLNPFDELRLMEYAQRLSTRRRGVLGAAGDGCGADLFRRATAGGAQALGIQAGALAAGYRADFVVLDADDPKLAGRTGDGILDAMVFATPNRAVRDVFVGGRQVVENGRHPRRDAIAAAYRQALATLDAG